MSTDSPNALLIGNHLQLFDVIEDPKETDDLSQTALGKATVDELSGLLLQELYGSDEAWLENGALRGLVNKRYHWAPHRSLDSQRGDGWPRLAKGGHSSGGMVQGAGRVRGEAVRGLQERGSGNGAADAAAGFAHSRCR